MASSNENFNVPPEAEAIALKAQNPYGNKVILLAHSNRRVNELNEQVRAYLWQQAHAPLQINDILMVCCNHFLSGLMNGDMVKVVAMAPQAEYKKITVAKPKTAQKYMWFICYFVKLPSVFVMPMKTLNLSTP
jgi:hypothetical protein